MNDLEKDYYTNLLKKYLGVDNLKEYFNNEKNCQDFIDDDSFVLRSYIEIDGADKTAKDTLHKFIEQVCEYKYNINVRGITTQLVYNRKFNRPYVYDLSNFRHAVIVLLTGDTDDIEIRCKATNEPKYNIPEDVNNFIEMAHELYNNEGISVLDYNTTYETPYAIAMDVKSKMDALNRDSRKDLIEDLFKEEENEEV